MLILTTSFTYDAKLQAIRYAINSASSNRQPGFMMLIIEIHRIFLLFGEFKGEVQL